MMFHVGWFLRLFKAANLFMQDEQILRLHIIITYFERAKWIILTHKPTQTQAHTQTREHTRAHMHTHTHTQRHTREHTREHTHTQTCTHTFLDDGVSIGAYLESHGNDVLRNPWWAESEQNDGDESDAAAEKNDDVNIWTRHLDYPIFTDTTIHNKDQSRF